ncbi:RBBP9/YdeN family alpha/beta hydrolase [Novosphingobium sp. BL-52-GroH]|uniref:RBBP9/YdeN family alpha/beta hydrolase n=1 Tax=Novosphingobium sp. BL-52-GroH TaxID=3349877 RepID=UPI00384CF0C7
MRERIVLPGIGGSGPDHWQSLWERGDPQMRRFAPDSWDHPRLDAWCAALDVAVEGATEPPLLVAHSLACLLVAHWSARSRLRVAGAFLVAIPDPHGPAFPAEARDFADPPERPLRFPSLVVASADDPYGSMGHARSRAEQWGSSLVDAGPLGHVNAASGLGDWPWGREHLRGFEAGLVDSPVG